MDEVRAKIIEILNEIIPEVDNDELENNKELVHSGVLNSFSIVMLIGELSDNFDIEISPQEIVYENFDSLDGLTAMVKRLSE
ncbi:MAG: acyl carrier protein [Bacilli bacterium]|nr:acyl carrier protein [Bacilli bacterium]